jgi:hypothetical protein
MESVSIALGNCIHALCLYPNEMKKLQQEIDGQFDSNLEVY